MSALGIADALQRAEDVLRKRPAAGLHGDAPATAIWHGDTRVVAHHTNGTQVPTDMPGEFGGTGDQVSPGWLFRAGVAACANVSIAMLAAREGVVLERLEVRVDSQSDARGMLGLPDADGTPVSAAPRALQMHIDIRAPGVAPEALRALVERGCARSPIPCAVQAALPLTLHIEAATGD